MTGFIDWQMLNQTLLTTGLDWPLCHRATEQWLTIVLRYDGTMASPNLTHKI